MWYEWVFEGIGTQLLIGLLGLCLAGVVGYKIIKKYVVQIQIGKDKVKQKQVLTIEPEKPGDAENNIEENIFQVQIAGNNAQQIQVGKIRGRRN